MRRKQQIEVRLVLRAASAGCAPSESSGSTTVGGSTTRQRAAGWYRDQILGVASCGTSGRHLRVALLRAAADDQHAVTQGAQRPHLRASKVPSWETTGEGSIHTRHAYDWCTRCPRQQEQISTCDWA